MPMKRELYPPDWDEIALQVKEEAGWKCEECGRQCYRPGEKCPDKRNVLTVSHKNHKPWDCRRENLQALCSWCHLRYDAKHHAETRRKNRERRKTMELNITDERLNEIIEKIVRDELSNSYDDSLYYTIKNKTEEIVRKMAADELAESFEKMAAEIAADFMDEKPVEINDGWGDRERFDSYTDFFAARLRKKIASDYEIKRMVKDAVERKVEAIWKQYEREVLDEIIARHAVEEGGQA